MTDLAQECAARPASRVAGRSGVGAQRPQPAADSGRASARAALDAALSGVELSVADRRFLARLSQWDKRNATTLASLISRARARGRRESALTAEQAEIVFAALMDAFAYRTCGASSAGCWNCANRTSGLCAEHARDPGRARAFAELAAALCGEVAPAEFPGVAGLREVGTPKAVAS
jgi:hypothetical protein